MQRTRKKWTCLLGFIAVGCLGTLAVMGANVNKVWASAETVEENISTEFVVTEYENDVEAVYEFIRLNDTDCSVRLTNKTEATRAIVPSRGTIDGVEYRVTEVAANGFMSSTNLVKVSLPGTMKKIGNMAFANCTKLNRVSLANVEEIGNNAFYRCTALDELVIPKSVETIGTYILRNANTYVRVRATLEECEDWTSSWNTGNTNQEVEYGSQYVQPLELEPVYNTLARTNSNEIIGYSLAGGQPRTDSFYEVNMDNTGEITEIDNENNIFIPAQYNGISITSIADMAFSGAMFNQLIVEYSSEPIKIGEFAFDWSEGESIVINRNIQNNATADYVFFGSTVKSIVLPDSLSTLSDSMFASCSNLTNIYFTTPVYIENREDMLDIVQSQAESIQGGVVELPQDDSFTTIKARAFEGANAISHLHIYDNVVNVGETVLGDWNDSTQAVYVHNEIQLPSYDENTGLGWHPQWKSNFTNINYDNEFYTITFNPDGGTVVPMEKVVAYGKTVGDLPIPVLPHHDFVCWEDTSGIEYNDLSVYNIKNDIVLKARWNDHIYKIELLYENSTDSSDIIDAIFNKSLPSVDENGETLQAPDWDGRRFLGYYSSTGELYYSKIEGENTLISNRTYLDTSVDKLYARWEEIEYEIIYSADLRGFTNPNQVTSFTILDVESNSFEFETIMDNSKSPVEKIVWSLEDIADAASTDYLDKGYLELSGSWVVAKATISYSLEGGTNNSSNKTTLNYGETLSLSEPSRLSYKFAGWYYNGDLVTEITNDIISNKATDIITLTAKWENRINGVRISLGRTLQTLNVPVYNGKVIIQLPSSNFYNPCHLIIPSGIQELHIYSPTTSKGYDLYITISSRSTDLDLHLENFSMCGPVKTNSTSKTATAYNGITMTTTNSSALNLYAYGNVTVAGATAQKLSGYTYDGAYAIDCPVLNVKRSDWLYLEGGYGGAAGGSGSAAISTSQVTLPTTGKVYITNRN